MLTLLRSGYKYTALETNNMFRFNDSRKIISDLRKEGHKILDYRLKDGRKVYYMQEDRQLSLFDEATQRNNEPQRLGNAMQGLENNPDSLLYWIEKHRKEANNGSK
ncbi:MAG: hypothetical protein U0L65_02400 [Bacteroidales bacterium]|nr:hypothetical protein [Bacteroidales bacterium]